MELFPISRLAFSVRSTLLPRGLPGLCLLPLWTVAAAWAQPQDSDALVERLVAESQKHRVIRPANPADPLWQAERQAVGLAADISSFNTWMLAILSARLERGDSAVAELADRLPGQGRALAHAELALAAARQRRNAEAETHLKSALEGGDRAEGPQVARLRSLAALALLHLGREDEAGRLQSRLGSFEQLELETRQIEDGLQAAPDLPAARQRILGLSEPAADELKARYLLACARRHFAAGRADSAEPFLEAVGEMSMQNGLPNAQRVLLDLARIAWAGGRQSTARKSLNLFLKCCEQFGDGAEWKAPFLAEAVGLLIDWRQPGEAREWLKRAEAGLGKVYVLDAPAALLAVARQRERLDGAAAGDRLVLQAVRAGRMHPHPRALAEAGVRVCLHYAAVRRPVPAAIVQAFSADGVEVAQ